MDEADFVFSIREGSDCFQLKPLTSADDYDFVSFAASVSVSGFTGENAEIWCDLRNLNRFFNELVELEQKRQGAATLETISAPSEYNELFVRLYSTDRLGNMALDVMLQKIQYVNGKIAPLKVNVSFVVDPANMLIIVAGFKKLLKFASKTSD